MRKIKIKLMKKILVIISIVLLPLLCGCQGGKAKKSDSQEITYSVQKIWDQGTHAAFTSLIEFNGKYYCSFREGYSHIFDENGDALGHIRVLESKDGNTWESVLDTGLEGIDCRDPKMCVTPDGRIMLIFGGSTYRNKELIKRQGYVMFSKDGRTFTEPEKLVYDPQPSTEPSNWLWRVTWNGDKGYGVSYGLTDEGGRTLILYETKDGINYSQVKYFDVEAFPNETTVRFLPDGKMMMMVRYDDYHGGECNGKWGVAEPPYTDWEFKDMGLRIGGPDFLSLEDGTILAGTRSYLIGKHCKTILLRGNLDGDFQEVLTLPSDGDTSYPGMLVVGDELWVSYYSQDGVPGKANIFLAKIPLEVLTK